MAQLDAAKTGFPINLVKVWERKAIITKGDKTAFELFKEDFDPKYKGPTAQKVWESRGGSVKDSKTK